MQDLTSLAVVGNIAGGQDPGDVALGHGGVLQFDLARQPVGARLRPREGGDDVIDARVGHFLRRLHGGADRAFGFLHRVDLAEAHPARTRRRRADHAKARLPRHGADAIVGFETLRPVETQDQTGHFPGAHVENRHDAALHRVLAHVPHCPLRTI